MFRVLAILIGTQALFTGGDLLARHAMKTWGFGWESFLRPWFLVYFLVRQVAMFGQLWVFTQGNLGKTMALFGAVSIVLSNVLALLLLNETLGLGSYLGVSLAVLAFLALAFLR